MNSVYALPLNETCKSAVKEMRA